MRYLANPSSPKVRDAMRAGLIGQMCTPAEGRQPLNADDGAAVWFAADNGCFSKRGYPGEERWFLWLERLVSGRENRCLFAVAPDRFNPALGDGMGLVSLERSRPWLPVIRALGVPAALVAQNGLAPEDVPWEEIDALFLGGTTDWKIGPAAARLAAAAKERRMHVHMGRVNSGRRWAMAEVFGCDSVDGTFIAFGPDVNLDRLLAWADPPSLWEAS
ncbi:hypothetical protein N8J89_07830 [Crossiella sp. CA-258035]|uniref:hypothetical protein n=1 Tax=Crossiella sp. CA-258035 TaxID=2981138 RepID=UPI0024BC9411|nr:hypothetical protein [Crossiella sp. CA-258035]WHT20963.1 hypothetical protein N8J89_07830 [Crossiella sp. CA-258035]